MTSENRANQQTGQQLETHHHDAALDVVVHYVAAAKPFKDDHAQRSETVGHLKARVLAAFGLVEGPTPGGDVATYTLNFHKTPLENPNESLGQVAGAHEHLELKLAQHLVQGDCEA